MALYRITSRSLPRTALSPRLASSTPWMCERRNSREGSHDFPVVYRMMLASLSIDVKRRRMVVSNRANGSGWTFLNDGHKPVGIGEKCLIVRRHDVISGNFHKCRAASKVVRRKASPSTGPHTPRHCRAGDGPRFYRVTSGRGVGHEIDPSPSRPHQVENHHGRSSSRRSKSRHSEPNPTLTGYCV